MFIVVLLLLAALVPNAAFADANASTSTLQLPAIDYSGSIFLYEYMPDMPGADPSFDLYAFELNLDSANSDKTLGVHSQIRIRDDKLRSYYNSDIWFQELYIYRKTDWGNFNIGKIYRQVGLTWDNSFFGNVEYFNGLMLNTNYGAEWVDKQSIGTAWALSESFQYFPNEGLGDTDGSLAGRDVNSDADAQLRDVVTARVTSARSLGRGRQIIVGLSGLNGNLKSLIAANRNYDFNQLAADVTLDWAPLSIYAEVLQQNGEPDDSQHPYSRAGYDSATYFLGGLLAHLTDRLAAYFNYSSANYVGQNALEQELLPGATYTVAQNLNVIGEFDYWRVVPHVGGGGTLIDRSLNLVAQYNF